MKQPLLIKKGAEASLYLASWHGRKVIMKKRLPKKYRLSKLDEQIKTYRTIHEPQLIHEAKKAGVPTPTIFLVNVKDATIIMEFIEGRQVKQLLNEASKSERQILCLRIGELIGRLHRYGIIHGDLTTSNMILSSEGKIFFVDFGLGEKSKELEARGVDLHLMKRALQSTHFRFVEECFNAVIEGYSKVLGSETGKNVLDKIREIERRGRYIAERKGD
ncbi:Kae1-associated serine/threonine protein kinase [Candidatus Bathyarchaeota archaeon]|nr:Kae1-associated serine/threonine protein kinase [Candidatus Bathyarchaeota archaeon]